jgi:hypothetical protein
MYIRTVYITIPCGGRIETSIVALRVVGGDEKGTQCLGVQLEKYKYGDRLGESAI